MLLLPLLLLSAVSPSVADDSTGPADVVLITISSLRADRLGWATRSRNLTPHMDEIAAGGYLIRRARTPVPAAVPAAVSALTGRDPRHHGVYAPDDSGKDVPTLAEVLKTAGFATAAVLGHPSMASNPQATRGLDETVQAEGRAPSDVARLALEELDGLPLDGGRYLWVHLDMRAPYAPPVGDLLEFLGDGTTSIWRFPLPVSEDRRELHTLRPGLTNGPLQSAGFLIDSYDAAVRSVDRGVGEIWAGLQNGSRASRTLFIVLSLHGEALGEHARWFTHGETLYEEELLVPILFHGPEIPAGHEEEAWASVLDVAPTVLGLLKTEKDMGKQEGMDLSRRIRYTQTLPERLFFACQLAPPFARTALYQSHFKLIVTPPRPPMVPGPDWWASRETREMYDLAKDPMEAYGLETNRPGLTDSYSLALESDYPPLPETPPARDTSRRR